MKFTAALDRVTGPSISLPAEAEPPLSYADIATALNNGPGTLDLQGGEFDFNLLAEAVAPKELIAKPVGDGTFVLEVRNA